tara:strand:- start:86 stop:301 length:216 start_codon:yes stop_codon:yes gene_type:complete
MSSLKHLKDLTNNLCRRQNKLKEFSKELDHVLVLLEKGSHDLVRKHLIKMSKKMCEEHIKIETKLKDSKDA